MKYAVDLEKFKEKLEVEINKIPENKRKEAELRVVGPALEAAKYCIEHEELRDMFAKLIASSMDSTKTIYNNAYSESIKQLTPSDAILLKKIFEHKILPVLTLCYVGEAQTTTPLMYFTIPFKGFEYSRTNETLINLRRCELVRIYDIPYDQSSDHYKKFARYYTAIKKLNFYNSTLRDFEYLAKQDGAHIVEREQLTRGDSFGVGFYHACIAESEHVEEDTGDNAEN